MSCELPPFVPHPLLRGAHAQTLAGVFLPGRRVRLRSVVHRVPLDDGDALALHDDCPHDWQPQHGAAVLVHGLAGCHASPYMRRTADKLVRHGVRAFRLDLRGAGAGATLARRTYHAACSNDLVPALRHVSSLTQQAPCTLVGFSLGGNIVLKLLGGPPQAIPSCIRRAAAIAAPIDLARCAANMRRGVNPLYDRHFAKLLYRQLRARRRQGVQLAWGRLVRRPRTIYELDAAYTAVVWEFGSVENYYRTASAQQDLARIELPTLVLISRDDPIVPAGMYDGLPLAPAVRLVVTEQGGHMGYVARRGADPDRRWLEWRMVELALRAADRFDGERGGWRR
jgi:predicted alpha/beta-fold hydrolase